MSELDDHQLLAEFARENSEAAFAALVERHVGLVYSTALRSVGNAHAAEEVSQAVFIILAQKVKNLSPKIILSGWLYQTTRLTAANFLRGEIRRQQREQEAYMQSTLNETGPEVWPQLAPLLDDALGKLGTADRNAIVLRFFENKPLAEVGAALGASEDAAKMRVNRALEKLRKIFGKRGVTLTAALIAGAVSANSVQAAPAGLAKTISVIAITKGATAGGSTLALVKGALKIMAWTKMKTAVVVGTAVVFTAAVVTPIITHHSSQSSSSARTQNSGETISPSSANPKTADEATRAIFETWGKGDWEAFYANFGEPGVSREMYDQAFTDQVKSYLNGVQIISLGRPTNSFNRDMWFVPYKIRFKTGKEKEFRLHIAQDPRTQRWFFKGGI